MCTSRTILNAKRVFRLKRYISDDRIKNKKGHDRYKVRCLELKHIKQRVNNCQIPTLSFIYEENDGLSLNQIWIKSYLSRV